MTTLQTGGESPMNIQQHLTTNSLTWKEIELALFRALQNAFAELFTALLEDIDRPLAANP
ncbi:UPF0236 family protein, partial [Anoxybacillus geothermalis]|nr:UPF0236 family protein [Anoxybacillus geothermalis]